MEYRKISFNNRKNTSMQYYLFDVSIIIPCKNEGNNLKITLDSIMKAKNNACYEILVVDDGSLDDSTAFLNSDIYKNVTLIKTEGIGCAEARNTGARYARGKYLFFCDAHIKVPEMWLDDLVNTLQYKKAHLVTPCICDMSNISSEGYGVTWNERLQFTWILNNPNCVTEIPLSGAACLCIIREVFDKINGFNSLLKSYGMEDQELCLKAWLYGYKLVINPDVKVRHLFRKVHPYKVKETDIFYNMLCVAYCHFNKDRIIKIINMLKENNAFSSVLAEFKSNTDEIINQRKKFFKERIYNDDYFFQKFNIMF
ncbi:glycosyltransferase [Clostridium sp. SYSU_GA19001]|uniref:glycosyltransferase family 2 protein n=1 Tax=Clostridium caldaquaticum TaxID=2940653 RepID=UPI0020772C21|nr:glycosyltransferase [Clostridium caldaquaticum]MCM8711261.1 glycosyltransferase [Clostridium caldaquaticum]